MLSVTISIPNTTRWIDTAMSGTAMKGKGTALARKANPQRRCAEVTRRGRR